MATLVEGFCSEEMRASRKSSLLSTNSSVRVSMGTGTLCVCIYLYVCYKMLAPLHVWCSIYTITYVSVTDLTFVLKKLMIISCGNKKSTPGCVREREEREREERVYSIN